VLTNSILGIRNTWKTEKNNSVPIKILKKLRIVGAFFVSNSAVFHAQRLFGMAIAKLSVRFLFCYSSASMAVVITMF